MYIIYYTMICSVIFSEIVPVSRQIHFPLSPGGTDFRRPMRYNPR